MQIIDYIKAQTSGASERELYFGRWQISAASECAGLAPRDEFVLRYWPLCLHLPGDFELDELARAQETAISQLPEWFLLRVGCLQDDFFPYFSYFENFAKCLQNGRFMLDFAHNMRDFLDAYAALPSGAKFGDLADFLHDVVRNFERLAPAPLLAFNEGGEYVLAEIEQRFNEEQISFIDYSESPCALVMGGGGYIDLQCGFDLDNLFDIMISDYSGIEGYVFEDGYCLYYGDFTNTNLVRVSACDHLPRKVSFENNDSEGLDLGKFAKSVLCNRPLIEWVRAGIRGFEDLAVRFEDGRAVLDDDAQKVELDERLRWCDLRGLRVADDVAGWGEEVWRKRVQRYEIARAAALRRLLEQVRRNRYCDQKNARSRKAQIEEIQQKLANLADECAKLLAL